MGKHRHRIKTSSKRIRIRSKGSDTRSETDVRMGLSEAELKRRLINKRRIVKEKLDILKHGEIVKEKMFSPITKHLKEIENTLHKNTHENNKFNERKVEDRSIKSEINYPLEAATAGFSGVNKLREEDSFTTPKLSNRMSEQLSTPLTQISLYQNETEDPSADKLSILDEVNLEDTAKERHSKFADLANRSYADYLDQYAPLPRKYISGMYSDDFDSEYDHKYGVRLDTLTEKFMIGDSRLDIDGSDVIVKKKRYRGTHGLYELLFKKKPTNFTREDVENYKQIVLKTHAHRRHYKFDKQIDGSKLRKYKKIIAPMASGSGILMEVDDNKIDYLHWDNPNELIDRLRLLLASVSAGHTNHINEINSIVEELREAQIIA